MAMHSVAVLPQSPISISHRLTSSSSSSSPVRNLIPCNAKGILQSSLWQHSQSRRKRSLVLNSAADQVSVADTPSPPSRSPGNGGPPADLIASLKLNLLSAISGLNRGLAANEDDLRKADAAAKDLESVGGLVDLTVDLDKLQGRWKLIYSSAFSSRTLGGSRPGPPTGRLLPITLGQVFQRIDILSKDFDNIVELQLGAPWPLPPVEVTATLAHKFELIGSSKIKINFEKTTVKATGNLSQLPPFEIPRIPDQFRPPSNTGSGEFEVTYLDSDTRVTRGDGGELRVFVIS
ncbi:plastid-lipid-associated protein 6, chloroplastic-like [Neltuma alba]|uniref:plastid-lipid-associated protein 6, chloroplastic-like n=1 Tax=Neltuma alba TaxID=207710 RepID=UPI0010A45327|nr:plastid-lipid-associated protein 6, chloroplastic-like [Prosopis alba]XP_028769630.1 plastid-lipid-associated protein 6, chloroplastic-like [Prosopis alba]